MSNVNEPIRRLIMLIMGTVIGVLGLYLVYADSGWQTCLGLFLFGWANNLQINEKIKKPNDS